MSKPYRVQVFGKAGCEKCHVLNQRLDRLLEDADWQEFEKEMHDVETEDGILAFSEAECVNPYRIPALVVLKHDAASGEYRFVPNRNPGATDDVCGHSRLYQYVGLQTDYSDAGRGVITPRMITTVLAEARG